MKIKKYFYPVLVFLQLFAITYFVIQSRNKTNEIAYINKEYNRLSEYINSKNEIEGKYIWELGKISKEEFNNYAKNRSNNKPTIFFIYEKEGCSSCYRLNVIKLNEEKVRENVVVIDIGEYKYLRNDFRFAEFIESNNTESKYKQLVLLVDKEGRIILSDNYELQQVELSKKFYEVVQKYF